MGSRVIRGPGGRARVVVVTVPSLGLESGQRFRVLGDTITAGSPFECMFAGTPTGRRAEATMAQTAAARPSAARHSWPEDYPERARELHAGGLSCPKVAAELGIPFGTAKSWIWPVAVGHTSP